MSTRIQRTQRVEKLMKEFMHYHNQGYSVIEIAKIFEVDFSTVYKHLQQIADANQVTRESLLQKPFSSYSSRPSYSKEKVDLEKIRAEFENVENSINEILLTVTNYFASKEI